MLMERQLHFRGDNVQTFYGQSFKVLVLKTLIYTLFLAFDFSFWSLSTPDISNFSGEDIWPRHGQPRHGFNYISGLHWEDIQPLHEPASTLNQLYLRTYWGGHSASTYLSLYIL